MESETVLCSADFHCDDPFLRRGEIFSDITFLFLSGQFRVIGHFVLILIPMKLDIVWLHRYFILFLRR